MSAVRGWVTGQLDDMAVRDGWQLPSVQSLIGLFEKFWPENTAGGIL